MINYEDIQWRLKLYKLMLEYIQNNLQPFGPVGLGHGLCNLVIVIINKNNLDPDHDYDMWRKSFDFLELLPELYLQKPKHKRSYSFWWLRGNVKPREKAVKKAIKLAEDIISVTTEGGYKA